MLEKLSQSGIGCYVGNVFCGALAYADDIVILAPNKSALSTMLEIAQQCAIELKLQFNGSKSQYVVFRSKHSVCHEKSSIVFSGANVIESSQGIHLGNILVKSSLRECITNAISDLNKRTNLLSSRFSFCTPEVRYRLFKSHCVIAYGSPLWNFDSPVVADYYTAWRKCVRRVWEIPYRTHCDLLSGICNDRDIETQLLSRSIKFLKTAMSSRNLVLSLCAKLVMRGSRSPLSNSISYIADKYNVDRHTVARGLTLPIDPPSPVCVVLFTTLRWLKTWPGEDRNNFTQILIDLCVD